MNALNKLTIKNLKLNKKRAIGTIVGIILSVALICAVGGMVTSFFSTMIANTVEANGYYHIELDNIDEDHLNKLKLNRDLDDINVFYDLGYSIFREGDEPYIKVFSSDEEALENISVKLTSGRYPKNKNEIIVTKGVVNDSDYQLGDTISLELGKRYSIDGFELNDYNPYLSLEEELVDTEKYEFKIVGIIDRGNWNHECIGVTVNAKSDDIRAYVSLAKPSQYKKSLSELLGADDYSLVKKKVPDLGYNYNLNSELLKWEELDFSDSTIKTLLYTAGIVIIIIIITSVFCIRNSFAISTLEKMKMYGMLASVGATKKQIRKSVIFEGVILGIIGIPIGVFCGIFADYVLIKIINFLLGDFLTGMGGMLFSVSFLAILLAVVLGFVTIYLSALSSALRAGRVSPIDNLRNTKDIKINSKKLKVPKFISSIFKTGGVLAYKNLKRSKKKYRTTIISLTVSILAFISMYSFINEGFSQTSNYYIDYDYNVYLYSPSTIENVEKKYQDIKKLDNINISYTVYSVGTDITLYDLSKINFFDDDNGNGALVDNCDENGNNCREFFYMNIIGLDDSTFKEYCKKIGANYNSVKDIGILYDKYRYYSESKKKEVITRKYKYEKDDVINGTLEYEDENKDLSIRIGYVTDVVPYGHEGISYGTGYLIVNKEYFSDIDFQPLYLLIDSENSSQLVKDIKALDYGFGVYSLEEQAKNEKSVLIVISIFLYGFITVITLIGVTNIFNTITSNMELRQKEFAMLKSIGMTKKEFNRMINLETLFYCSKSLIYGIILGILGSLAIHSALSNNLETAFVFPYKAILIAIIFVFIIVYVIMRYSISKINKQNTIETIRNDNV